VGPAYESVVFDVCRKWRRSPTNRTFDVEWDESDPATIEEGTSESLDILVSDSTSGERIDGAAVDVSFAPRGTVNGPPSISNPPVTDSDGRTTVSFGTNDAQAGDSFDLYASSGDDVDRIVVDIVPLMTIYDVVSVDLQSAGGNDIDVTFEIDTNDPDAQVNVQSIREQRGHAG